MSDESSPSPTERSDDVVDAHVHVWDPAIADYSWLVDVPQLARAFHLDEVDSEHAAAGVNRLVLVQAEDHLADTQHMIRAARTNPRVAGIVGWVPIRDANAAATALDGWHEEPIVGVRHLVHRDPDGDLLIAAAVDEVLDLLAERRLAFDICAESLHLLALVPRVAERHPDLTLVIDHLAKPPIRQGGWDPWASLLRDAAAAPNVVAKVSGLNTAAERGATWREFAPYVEHAIASFGADRLMYGSDWPFALLSADSYSEIWNGLRGCLEHLDDADRQAILSTTATRAYRL